MTQASTVRIRESTRDDWTRIATLTVDAYVDGGFLPPSDSYVEDLADVRTRAGTATLLVAEAVDAGAATGTVAASVAVTEAGSSFSEVARAGEIEFRMLAVAAEFRGRGIGRALVRHIVDSARRRPELTGVTLCSMRSMTTAHALYRSEGFVTDPDRDFVLNEAEHGVDARFPFFIRHL